MRKLSGWIAAILILFVQETYAMRLNPEEVKQLEHNRAMLSRTYPFLGAIRFPMDTLIADVERDGSVGEVPLKAGTKAGFDLFQPKLLWGTLGRDTRLGDLKCKGGTEFRFDPQGAPMEVTLAEPHELDSALGKLWCRDAIVRLGSTGIVECLLSRQMRIGEETFPQGTKLELSHSSPPLLLSVRPGKEAPFKFAAGAVLARGERTELHENGILKQGWLAHDQKVLGIPGQAGSDLVLYPSGKLRSVRLAQNFEIQGVPGLLGSHVSFYESGKLLNVGLSRDFKYQGVPCAARNDLTLHENGKIQRCRLSEDAVVQELSLKASDFVSFDVSGKRTSGQ